MKIRRLLFTFCILLTGVVLAGCVALEPAAAGGPGDEKADAAATAGNAAPTVTFTAADYAFDGPDSIPGGLTRIEFVNPGEQEHSLWLVKLEDGKTIEDMMGVFATFETDPQMPDRLGWYGGVNAKPGQSNAYTIDLAPGIYTIFSFGEDGEGVPDLAKGMTTELEVIEAVASGAEPPEADMRTELVDFSYVMEGTPVAGPTIVEVTNSGMEPHEVAMLKLDDGISTEDAMQFLMAGEEAGGPPPFMFFGGMAPINSGLTAWYEIDFEEGDYGFICFLPSPDSGGAPHFMLGMTAQVSVPGS